LASEEKSQGKGAKVDPLPVEVPRFWLDDFKEGFPTAKHDQHPPPTAQEPALPVPARLLAWGESP